MPADHLITLLSKKVQALSHAVDHVAMQVKRQALDVLMEMLAKRAS